jgi:hypothetical protein
MAGLTGHKALTKGLIAHLTEQEMALKFDAWSAAVEAAAVGQEKIKWTIDHTESALVPGKDNRNFTYEMNHSVDSRVDRNGNTISIRVGWLENKRGYFLIQEHGGQKPGGGTITPMLALMAGHKAVIDTLNQRGLKTT